MIGKEENYYELQYFSSNPVREDTMYEFTQSRFYCIEDMNDALPGLKNKKDPRR